LRHYIETLDNEGNISRFWFSNSKDIILLNKLARGYGSKYGVKYRKLTKSDYKLALIDRGYKIINE